MALYSNWCSTCFGWSKAYRHPGWAAVLGPVGAVTPCQTMRTGVRVYVPSIIIVANRELRPHPPSQRRSSSRLASSSLFCSYHPFRSSFSSQPVLPLPHPTHAPFPCPCLRLCRYIPCPILALPYTPHLESFARLRVLVSCSVIISYYVLIKKVFVERAAGHFGLPRCLGQRGGY